MNNINFPPDDENCAIEQYIKGVFFTKFFTPPDYRFSGILENLVLEYEFDKNGKRNITFKISEISSLAVFKTLNDIKYKRTEILIYTTTTDFQKVEFSALLKDCLLTTELLPLMNCNITDVKHCTYDINFKYNNMELLNNISHNLAEKDLQNKFERKFSFLIK